MAKRNKEANKQAKSQKYYGQTFGAKLVKFLKEKTLGKILLAILVILILFFFNLLVSGDRLETFSLLTGIELLLIILIAWLVFLWKRKEDSEGSSQ